MSYIKLAEEVRRHISNNETEQAIALMRTELAQTPYGNTLLIQSAKASGLKKDILNGSITLKEADLTRNTIHTALLEIVEEFSAKEMKETTAFISYNREDVSKVLAKHLHDEIEALGFNAFMDVEDIPFGADWVSSILDALHSCKYFVLLLSEKANQSEMVIKEVEEAYRVKKNTGYPIILPIRVQFPIGKQLNARLHSLLFRIQQLEWNEERDTQNILAKIADILHQKTQLETYDKLSAPKSPIFVPDEDTPPSPVAPLEVPRGAMPLTSPYYVKRQFEDEFISSVQFPGSILRIRGPRQYGKTSMLTRVVSHAAENGYSIIAIDFSEIDEHTIQDLDQLLWEFCNFFAEELDLYDELDTRWQRPRQKKQITTSFIEKEILRKREEPILLALDEADRLFAYPEVSTEFFLLLRSWHERSRLPNKKEWEKFRLCLSYSTEAKLAIRDMNASPFNVGEEAHLDPFSKEQISDLAKRHALNWQDSHVDKIKELLGGQPYLVRRAMYMIAKTELTFEELIANAALHNGPFSDHLRHHLINIKQFDDVAKAMVNIIEHQRCNDPLMATRLEAAGLVKGSPPEVRPSNDLYATYFKGKL